MRRHSLRHRFARKKLRRVATGRPWSDVRRRGRRYDLCVTILNNCQLPSLSVPPSLLSVPPAALSVSLSVCTLTVVRYTEGGGEGEGVGERGRRRRRGSASRSRTPEGPEMFGENT